MKKNNYLKVPAKISTLKELVVFIMNNDKYYYEKKFAIGIGKRSKLLNIAEFNLEEVAFLSPKGHHWKVFRGIPVKYL